MDIKKSIKWLKCLKKEESDKDNLDNIEFIIKCLGMLKDFIIKYGDIDLIYRTKKERFPKRLIRKRQNK